VFDGTTYICSCESTQCDSNQCHCYPGPGAAGGASACGHDKCTDYPSLCQCVSSSKVQAKCSGTCCPSSSGHKCHECPQLNPSKPTPSPPGPAPPSPTPAPPPPPPPPTPYDKFSAQEWLGPGDDTKDTILLKTSVGKGQAKCIDLQGGNTTNGAPVVIWDCNNGASQQWHYDSFVSGMIKYKGDMNKCLDLDLSGGSADNGNTLQIWDCNSHNNQMWWGGGTYQFLSSMPGAGGGTKCIDLYAGDSSNGKRIEIWDCIKGSADFSQRNAASTSKIKSARTDSATNSSQAN
jgi:hypothetical protein